MKVKDAMFANAACCTSDTSLQECCRKLVDGGACCCAIVEDPQSKTCVGMVVAREVCRAVAEGKNPLKMTARQCMMTMPCTITSEMGMEECCELLDQHHLCCAPVVDEENCCCGVVSRAELARQMATAKKKRTAASV
jgi:predicted transcriptional regulator